MKKDTTTTPEKKPRIVSPEKLALREKYKLESKALEDAEKSAATLSRITGDLIPKLTDEDAGKLWSNLGALARISK